MCLAGTLIASWSLTQQVASLSPYTVMINIFVTEFSEFCENISENSIVRFPNWSGKDGIMSMSLNHTSTWPKIKNWYHSYVGKHYGIT